MAKHKINKKAIRREVSSIFVGASVQQSIGAQQPFSISAPNGIGYPSLKLPAQGPQNPPISPLRRLYQLTEELQKAAANQPKVDTTKTTTNRGLLRRIENKFFAPKPGVNATRQKAMMILAPILLIVFIFLLAKVLSKPSRKITQPHRVESTKAVAAFTSEIDWQIPPVYPTTLREPTQVRSTAIQPETGKIGAETAKDIEPAKLIVKGILYSKNKPSALVGDQIVHEGDRVLGTNVIKISRDSVELEMKGKRWRQKVQETPEAPQS